MKKAFLLLLLFLVFVLGLGGCSVIRDSFTEEYSLKEASKLKISSKNGSVSVTGWQEDYLRLRAVLTVNTDHEDLEYRNFVEIVPEWHGEVFELTVLYPPRPPHVHSVSATIELEVPQDKIEQVEVETNNGSLGFFNLRSALAGTSTNGRITVEDCEGEIDLKTTNGQVVLKHLRFRGEKGSVVTTNGRIEADVMFPRTGYFLLRTTNGPIDLKLPSWTEGIIRMKTSTGSISVDQMPGALLLRSDKNLLEIQMHGDGIYLEVEISNGNINLGESDFIFSSAVVI